MVSRLWGSCRAMQTALKVFICLSLLGLLSLSSGVSHAEMTGTACVVSGDTIALNGKRTMNQCEGGTPVRLHGIDAPELKQECREASGQMTKCGLYAAAYLLELVKNQVVTCKGNSQDRDGRWLLLCFVGDFDVNRAMVRSGWAVAYEYLSGRYLEEEKGARNAGVGMWRMDFVRPDDWRHGMRLADIDDKDKCRIKGNVSATGVRTYYLPDGNWYDQTRIDEAKGERWFCTEQDAIDAGWQPAAE